MSESSILNISESYVENDDIKSYEYNEYLPSSGSNLNIPGTISIHIESQDEFYHPRKSYLLIEGDLIKADNTRYAKAATVALANNGLMHLFSNIKYEISGQEIESINNPGIATTIMGLAKFPFEYVMGVGMMQCWSPATTDGVLVAQGFSRRKDYIILKPEKPGQFSFIMELENMFGFAEDYDKVMYGLQHKISLVRKGDNDAIYGINAAAGKVRLSKVSWMMPRVHPNDAKRFDLYKQISTKLEVNIAFRKRQCNILELPEKISTFDWRLGVRSAPEKPRHILIAFQTDRANNQAKNPSQFDNVDISQINIVMNDIKFPARDIIADFPKHKYIQYYRMFAEFTSSYYGLDPLTSSNFVDPITYKEEYPIFYFDVSKQSERLTQSVVDIMVQMRFNKEIPLHVRAYALIISDRRIKLLSDGKKMNIVT